MANVFALQALVDPTGSHCDFFLLLRALDSSCPIFDLLVLVAPSKRAVVKEPARMRVLVHASLDGRAPLAPILPARLVVV